MGPDHRMVRLFIPQLLMVLTAPFHAGMARLTGYIPGFEFEFSKV